MRLTNAVLCWWGPTRSRTRSLYYCVICFQAPPRRRFHPQEWGSEIQRLVIFFHLSISFAILLHSLSDLPLHSLMSSVHLLLGRPRGLLPCTFPWRMIEESFPALVTWPKYPSFLFIIWGSSWRVVLSSSNIDWLVLISVQLTLSSLRYAYSSKASILFLSSFLRVQLSQP